MKITDTSMDETLLDSGDEIKMLIDQASAPAITRPLIRDWPAMMRKIPVTITLEVGSARISLQELMSIGRDSVIELDVLAGEPLTIKVNGTAIGRAEVVVAGENYGLKVLDLDGLDLESMGQ